MPEDNECTKRKDFLLAMYSQMWQNINRHILVVWQSVGVLAGAFAVLALVEKNVMSLDIAVSLIILIAAWLVAHVFDASGWYDRNLLIIDNIERQFLTQQDLHDVHYYFGEHSGGRKPIEHLQVQLSFGIGIAGLVLLHHFLTRVVPGIGSPISNFDPPRALPYVTTAIAGMLLYRFWGKQCESYRELLAKSPGIKVETKEEKTPEDCGK